MKVVIIGLGSMGKRRIRLIRKYDSTIIMIGIDSNSDRREASQDEYNILTYSCLEEVIGVTEIDCAFICTAPLSHHKIITSCLENGIHVFSELNLVSDGYDKNIALAKEKNLLLFLSSTFLYREEVKKIKSIVEKSGCLLNYTYHIGQYLPDWHPWENYKNFFVDNIRSNGCREIFAIELPWLLEVFGEIVTIDVAKSKISSLDINYNDNYMVILQHSSGHKGTLAVDIVSRKAVRNLEVFGEHEYLSWDGTPTGLFQYNFITNENANIELYDEIDRLENYNKFVIENAYLNEIISFFDTLQNRTHPIYNFDKDKEILNIIDRIEA
ncbi:Predicted dehydrogenase [Anaerocolumna jejuensis DSM 15929]|uniref:Predicted dehydrogenase n=1 Tax=Anaerocolumna jejuensis DSM 15929 TaxID=1121322 RepID=A0A1M7B470_9FIRM|nr:Gfo/Idh/MocA family oxidoreductase [Anaerocolumna jejuensis]SHL49747.1 Predicted dehydrogenase [Anaerocolumna jejuensis DSM 15929]